MRAIRAASLVAMAVVVCAVALTTVAHASYMDVPLPQNGYDPSGGYFALEAISGTDNPATPDVEVNAGEPIKVRLTVDSVNEGDDLILPPIPVPINVYLYLYKDDQVVASMSDIYVYTLPTVRKGERLRIQESRNLKVPTDLAPGSYVLVAHSYFDVPGDLINSMIQSNQQNGAPTPEPGTIPDAMGATKSWPVTVINHHYQGTITPKPTPNPDSHKAAASAGMSFGREDLDSILNQPGDHAIKGNGINGVMKVGDKQPLQLATDDISAPDVNGASASLVVNFSKPPSDGSLDFSILPQPDPDVDTQFALGAINSNYDITDIAYVLAVDRHNIENTVYTIENGTGKEVPVTQGNVQNALIVMKVSPDWVSAHGGVDAVKILRYDNGTAEVLDTHYVGTENGQMVFEGVSPKGLSQFALTSVTSLSMVAHTQAVEHPPGLVNIPFWEKLILMALVGIVLFAQLILAIVMGLVLIVSKAIARGKK